jgi:peptide/nickel transport system substrate-binding protein
MKMARLGVPFMTAAALTFGATLAHAQGEEAKRGGTLTIGLASQAECLDPQQHQHGFDSQQGRALVDSLTDQSQQEASKIVPWLAKSWEISDDATEYTFSLRDDVTFSDGTKLDAAVVKANFDALKAIPAAAGAEYLTAVKEIAVVDPHTVKITFVEPNIAFLAASATTRLGIVSAATAARSSDERCKEGIVGSGPFVIERSIYNEELVLRRREGYDWASSVVKHQGEAYLDTVVYKVIPEASVRTGALASGQVDITAASYQDADSLKQSGFNIINASYVGTSAALFFNTARPLASDLAVRRAFLHAIDTAEIVELVQNGYVEPAKGLLTPVTPGFLDQSAAIAFDPELSARLLDEAGWVVGADSVRAKDGKRLTLIGAFWANPTNIALFEVIQAQAALVGIEVKLNPEPSSPAYLQGQIDGKYDFFRWHWSLADVDVLRKDYSSEGLNRLRLPKDNAIDPLLFAQKGIVDPAKRIETTNEAQRIVIDQAYSVPLFSPDNLWAASAKVRDFGFAASGPSQIVYDTWIQK